MYIGRPKTGKLIQVRQDKSEHILYYDLPFALLQFKRNELIKSGIRKDTLKVRYL